MTYAMRKQLAWRRWLIGVGLSMVLCGVWGIWIRSITVTSREAALPVMQAIMLGDDVPSGWRMRPELLQKRDEFVKMAGEATEAYVYGSYGYPGNHHFILQGLSKRGGEWWIEDCQFDEGQKLVFYYFCRKPEPYELERAFRELDLLVKEQKTPRADLNFARK